VIVVAVIVVAVIVVAVIVMVTVRRRFCVIDVRIAGSVGGAVPCGSAP
jgi:hypothetical protein